MKDKRRIAAIRLVPWPTPVNGIPSSTLWSQKMAKKKLMARFLKSRQAAGILGEMGLHCTRSCRERKRERKSERERERERERAKSIWSTLASMKVLHVILYHCSKCSWQLRQLTCMGGPGESEVPVTWRSRREDSNSKVLNKDDRPHTHTAYFCGRVLTDKSRKKL